jgi:putative (di)nucleoside polyphosphate hydrolase
VPKSISSSRRLSCGIVILSPARELLLCHVTGQRHWDLPKGGIDAGESQIEAALRETREETGLVFEADQLVDLGLFDYTPKKNLHLFATLIERVDTSTLHCHSHFIDRASGRQVPEMDDFGWFCFDRVASLCTGNMAALLEREVHLDSLFDDKLATLNRAISSPARVQTTRLAA